MALPTKAGRLLVDEAVAAAKVAKTPPAERPGETTEDGKNQVNTPRVGSLMRVVVEVAGRTYDEDLATQAFIAPNVDALNTALATNPSRYAEWAMLEALAKREGADIDGKVAVLDTDIKEREAQAYLDVINAAPLGGKPPTVDAIKAMVVLDAKRIELVRQRQALDAARIVSQDNQNKLAVGRKTMEEKKDSLLELSRNWRQEMQTQLTTNADKFKPGGR